MRTHLAADYDGGHWISSNNGASLRFADPIPLHSRQLGI
jgi:hypothetical protein